MLITPPLMFTCEPPGGAAHFEAAIIDTPTGLHALTNRRGAWTVDRFITPADLMMPEMEFEDWTFREIEPRDIEVETLH